MLLLLHPFCKFLLPVFVFCFPCRGICMMRKALGSPEDLHKLPSLLGRIFRIAMYGKDDFDYSVLYKSTASEKNGAWKVCRDGMGMHSGPEKDVSTVDDGSTRQQYVTKH